MLITPPVQRFLEYVAPEMHALFWTAPFMNPRQRMLDRGWHCREHAWASALLLGDSDIDCQVVHGKVEYVLPPATKAGQPLVLSVGHTWVRLVGRGHLDISVQQRCQQDGFVLELPQMINGTPVPVDWGQLIVVDRGAPMPPVPPPEHVSSGFRRAVYKVSRYEEPGRVLRDDPCGWINSPLSDGLKARYGRYAYECALAHLKAVMQGAEPSLTPLKLWAAWDAVTAACPTRPMLRD